MSTDGPSPPPDPDPPRRPRVPDGSGAGQNEDFVFGDAEDTAEFPPPTLDADEIIGLREHRRVSQVGPRGTLPLEEEASTLVARYLFPTEKFRGEWRKHPIKLWRELLLLIVATVILGWATGWFGKHNHPSWITIAVLVWIFVLFFVGWRILDWWYDRFILTNKRIMVVSGLVTRTVGMMPLVRVTDMKYEQSPLARLLNYGTFVVESAGQDQALRTVKPLPNPNELYLRIVEEMYEPEAVEARLSRVADEDTDI